MRRLWWEDTYAKISVCDIGVRPFGSSLCRGIHSPFHIHPPVQPQEQLYVSLYKKGTTNVDGLSSL